MEKKKSVFLVGAGGSSPFIPNLTTEKLTNALLDPCRWKNIIEKFEEEKKEKRNNSEINIGSCDVTDILCRIKKLLKNNEFYKDKINFEYLIHLLDKVSLYYKAHNCDEIHNIDTILMDFFQKYENLHHYPYSYPCTSTNPNGWEYVPFLARELIIEYILDSWNKIEEKRKEEIKDINREFYSKLLEKHFESINIYSLNYDPLLYESLSSLKENKRFETGFEDNNENKFDKQKFFQSQNVLAFFHGHVGFVPGGNLSENLSGNLNSPMKFYHENYKDAQKKRFEYCFPIASTSNPSVGIGAKGMHFNRYLITGLDKIDAFSENPFASYIHRISKDISEANSIVLIGTSLNDYHLNSFLVNSLVISKNAEIVFVTTKNSIKEFISTLKSANESLIARIWDITRDKMIEMVERRKELEKLTQKLENRVKEAENSIINFSKHIKIFGGGTEKFYGVYLDYLKNNK